MERGSFCNLGRTADWIRELGECRISSAYWDGISGGAEAIPVFGPEDVEFTKACLEKGVKAFGCFCPRFGSEYVVEVDESESRLVSAGQDKKVWWGLREFSQSRYPRIFKRFEEYFPDGVYNSEGERVRDLLDECVARDVNGKPIVIYRYDEHRYLYFMCWSNPAWRRYTEKVAEALIDAGVPGLHIDGPEDPLASVCYGGCYCKECMKDFRAHLKHLEQAGKLPRILDGEDLETFDYAGFLRGRGINPKEVKDPRAVPLYKEYFDSLMYATVRNYREVVGYIKEYGRRQGREVLVAGNSWLLDPHYIALEPFDHLVFELPFGMGPIPESELDPYRGAPAFRFAAGWSRGRPVVAVEYPKEAFEKSLKGGGGDLFRLMSADAAAFGGNLAVTYKGWPWSYSTPKDVIAPYQRFLAEHEDLYSTTSSSELGVVYSFPSYYWLGNAALSVGREFKGELPESPYAGGGLFPPEAEANSFWGVSRALVRSQASYDVIVFGDCDLVPDRVTARDLEGYEVIAMPDCTSLTSSQLEMLTGYLSRGGRLVVFERFAENLGEQSRQAVLNHPSTVHVSDPRAKKYQENLGSEDRLQIMEGIRRASPHGLQVECSPRTEKLGLHLHSVSPRSTAMHLVNYSYSRSEDRVIPLENISIKVRLSHGADRVTAYTPDKNQPKAEIADGRTRLSHIDIYTVLLLEELKPL